MKLMKIYVLFLLVIINIRGAEMFTEWECKYRSDGDVKWCRNMTQLDTSQLTGSIPVYTRDILIENYFNVTAQDIRGWYQRCSYDRYDGQPDECYFIIVVPADTGHLWCEFDLQHLYSSPAPCINFPASLVCLGTQPRTHRLLHQAIPPTVYITGLMFNIMIILVLCFKAEKSVLNFLLLMLSVWDLLYLGCLVVESVIGHYTGQTQIQISDLSYAWLEARCELLGDSYAFDVRRQWYSADYNIEIKNHNYQLMYWLHVAALVFQIASVYQTIVIATFRCIAIRWPFQAPQLLTSTTAAVATGCCLLLGIAVHVPAFIGGALISAFKKCEIKWNKGEYSFSTYLECLSNIATAHNPLYSASTSTFSDLHHFYHVITYSIILFLALPFLLLLVLNILMLAELYSGTGSSHDDENKAVTKVVAAIVTVFLITYLIKPLYIVDIFYFDGHIMNTIAFQSCGGYFTMSIIITVLPAINSVINLLLYVGLRKTFREQFTSMFPFCTRNTNPHRPEAIPLQAIHR